MKEQGLTALAVLGDSIVGAGLLPPRQLTLSLTSACNLQCQHCWIECSPAGPVDQVGLSGLQGLVREFSLLGVTELCLTGGEPLLHPQWREILSACCQTPGIDKVVLQTNGTLISARVAKLLSAAPYAKLQFQVSLDGCSVATHDLIRGGGSLDLAMKGLRCLVDDGLAARTTLAFTEMQHNLHEVPVLLELADQLGLARVVGFPLIKAGSAGQSEMALPPTTEQYVALLERFASDELFRARYERIGSFPAIEWARGDSRAAHGGCRFMEKPYVTADGMVYPCALLQAKGFAGRGAYQRSLPEVIMDVLPAWEDLMRLSRMRLKEMACIDSCLGGLHCGGGCLARAYVPSGSLAAREDRCALRQQVYAWQADAAGKTR